MRTATATDLARKGTKSFLDLAELGEITEISRGDLGGEPRMVAALVPWSTYATKLKPGDGDDPEWLIRAARRAEQLVLDIAAESSGTSVEPMLRIAAANLATTARILGGAE